MIIDDAASSLAWRPPPLPTTGIIWLHTATDGRVWYAVDDNTSTSSMLAPEEFVAQALPAQPRLLRLIGCHDNVELVVALCRARAARAAPWRVEIGHHACTPWHKLIRQGAFSVLLSISRLAQQAPSRGGWEPLSPAVSASYQLAWAALQYQRRLRQPASDDVRAEAAQQLADALRWHPLWPALSFLTPFTAANATAAALLIGLILDPRYYLEPDAPERTYQLWAYLGLNNSPGNRISQKRRERAKLALDVWKTAAPPADLDQPGAFLWRFWAEHQATWPGAADQRTTRLLLKYLRQCWLALLAAPAYRRELLALEHLFKRPADAVACREHLAENGFVAG